MFKSLLKFNEISNTLLLSEKHQKYKNKLYVRLSYLCFVVLAIRAAILCFSQENFFVSNEFALSILPLLVLIVSFGLFYNQKYAISKFVALIFLPFIGMLTAIYYNDKTILTLIILFSIGSFIIYDKMNHCIAHFIYNSLVFISGNIYLKSTDGTMLYSNAMLFYFFNTTVFIVMFYYLMLFLKNSFNQVFKNLYHDNEQLNDQNAALIGMHEKLVLNNKQLEEKHFAQSKNYENSTRLFSVISHDVKGPLVSVKRIFDYAKEEADIDQIKEFFPEIKKTITNTVQLLDNLLLWSKYREIEAVEKKELIHLHNSIKSVMELYSTTIKSKNLLVEFDVAKNVYVEFNVEMLDTILRNIISNAIKHSKSNGTVRLYLDRKKELINLHVSNTAYVVNDEEIDKLNNLDIPINGKSLESGSGLGLFIAKEFLKKTNTAIHYEKQNHEYIDCSIAFKNCNNKMLRSIPNEDTNDYFSNAE